jgi:tetratricopeptide (TPR) repeat protein
VNQHQIPKWSSNDPRSLPNTFVDRKDVREELSKWLKRGTPIAEVIAPPGYGKTTACAIWMFGDILRMDVNATVRRRDLKERPDEPLSGIVWWALGKDTTNFDAFAANALVQVCPDHPTLTRKHSTDELVCDLVDSLRSESFLVVLDGFERLFTGYDVIDSWYSNHSEDDPDTRRLREVGEPNARLFLEKIAKQSQTFKSRIVLTSQAGVGSLDGRDDCCKRIKLRGLTNDEDVLRLLKELGVKGVDEMGGPGQGTSEDIERLRQAFGDSPAYIQAVAGLVNLGVAGLGDLSKKMKSYTARNSSAAGKGDAFGTQFGDFLVQSSILGAESTILKRLSAIRGPFSYQEFGDVVRSVLKPGSHQIAAVSQFFEEDKPPAEEELKAFAAATLQMLLRLGLMRRHSVHAQAAAAVAPGAAAATKGKGDEPHSGDNFMLADWAVALSVRNAPEDVADEALERLTLNTSARKVYRALSAMKDNLACQLLEILQKDPSFEFGGLHAEIELIETLLPRCAASARTDSERAETARLLQHSALLNSRVGRPDLAISQLEKSAAVFREIGNVDDIVSTLGLLAVERLKSGCLAEADKALHELIEVCETHHRDRDRIAAVTALVFVRNARDAGELPVDALLSGCFEEREGDAKVFGGLHHALTALRQNEPKAAADYAALALEHAAESDLLNRTRLHWLLGESCLRLAREGSDRLAEAETNLQAAHDLCVTGFWPDYWADILHSLARLRYHQGKAKEAAETAKRAQTVSENHQYRLKLADIHNLLAQISLDAGRADEALSHAKIARENAGRGSDKYRYQPAFQVASDLILKLEPVGV